MTEPITEPCCAACGVLYPRGRRTSQERLDDAAVKAGWILGLPHNRMLCPEHKEEPWATRK